jgi:hypothetical protein
MDKQENRKYEMLFWSIALPGFGQLLNGKIIKGLIFIALEFLVNVQANFNEVIISSFQGDIQAAIQQTDYQWLMFYPCLYMFAIWDAYRDAGGGKAPYAFFPFVFAAYFVTTGLIYSDRITIIGVLLGPVFLPMLSLVPGIVIGYFIRALFLKRFMQQND